MWQIVSRYLPKTQYSNYLLTTNFKPVQLELTEEICHIHMQRNVSKVTIHCIMIKMSYVALYGKLDLQYSSIHPLWKNYPGQAQVYVFSKGCPKFLKFSFVVYIWTYINVIPKSRGKMNHSLTREN